MNNNAAADWWQANYRRVQNETRHDLERVDTTRSVWMRLYHVGLFHTD